MRKKLFIFLDNPYLANGSRTQEKNSYSLPDNTSVSNIMSSIIESVTVVTGEGTSAQYFNSGNYDFYIKNKIFLSMKIDINF